MSFITNIFPPSLSWAWNTLSSAALSETGRSIGKIGGGAFLFEAGRRIASHSWHHPAYHATPWRSRAAVLLGAGMCAAGAYLAVSGVSELVFPRASTPSAPTPSETTPFPTSAPPSTTPLHPYEEKVQEIFGKEGLRFNQNDSRDKVLLLTAKDDWDGALYPKFYGFLHDTSACSPNECRGLNARFDIKYKIVESANQVCQELQEASRSDRLAGVIIDAHGTPFSMTLNKGHDLDLLTEFPDPCFQGSPQAKIVLNSCSTGQRREGIAQHLADIFQRVTYAPTGPIGDSYGSNDLEIHPHFRPSFFGRRAANAEFFPRRPLITPISIPNLPATPTTSEPSFFSQLVHNICFLKGAYTVMKVLHTGINLFRHCRNQGWFR